MILKARKVRLKPKERMALEILRRTPTTPQRDARRARIVLLAAAGHSSRSIAAAVGVRPNVASLWRNRFADQGLEGLKDKPRPGKKPIYGAKTGKRILALLDRPAPKGYARWTGPLLAAALGDVDVQYVWRFLRCHKIDLVARKSWCESDDPQFAAKAADVVGLYIAPPKKAIVLCVDEKPSIQALERAQGYFEAAERTRLDRPEPRLHPARHVDAVRRARRRHRQNPRRPHTTPPPRRVPRLYERHRRRLSWKGHPCRPRQPEYPQEERALAQAPSQHDVSLHANPGLLAQPSRDLVLDPSRKEPHRRFLHRRQTTAKPHRCLHQGLQRERHTLRMDQNQGPPTSRQRATYQSTLIPGTRSGRHGRCLRRAPPGQRSDARA